MINFVLVFMLCICLYELGEESEAFIELLGFLCNDYQRFNYDRTGFLLQIAQHWDFAHKNKLLPARQPS